jgi:hypothetical protein
MLPSEVPDKLTLALQAAIDEFEHIDHQRIAEALGGKTVNLYALFYEAASDSSEARELLIHYPELDADVPVITCRNVIRRYVPDVVAAAEGLVADDDRTKLGTGLADSLKDVAHTLLAIHLGRELLPDFETAATRCCEMAKLSLQVSPSQKVRSYLNRLSRCYLLKLDAECVIIARAVLENSLRDRFDAEGQRMPSKMHERLKHAVTNRWLSPLEAKNAMDVWQRGNKAVHEDVELVRDVWGTIELTLSVASRLYNQ